MSDIPWDDLMDAAGDSDFAPIPASDYNVKIVATEATTSSTHKPMWKITAEVLDGPHAGRKLFTQQTLTQDSPNALDMFFRQMAAAGLTREFFRTRPNPDQIADALMGRTFRARVQIKEYQGSPRNEIKAWNPASGASLGAPPPVNVGRTGGPPPPPAAAPAAVPPPPAPAASAPPAPAAAPVAATPPPAAPAAPAAPAPAPEVAPPPAPEAQPAVAVAAPAGGDAASWVVEQRQTGSHEPPPF